MKLIPRRSFFRAGAAWLLALASAAALWAAEPSRLYAVVGAYPPEIEALHKEFGVKAPGFAKTTINGIEFWRGAYQGRDIVVFRAGVSLVNAAYVLQMAFDKFPSRTCSSRAWPAASIPRCTWAMS